MRITSLLLVMLGSVNVFGQISEISLKDHSVIRANIIQQNLNIKTRYGTLTIPYKDIKSIDFGFHTTEKLETEILLLIKDLGNVDFKIRKNSQKKLIEIGRYSTFYLRKNSYLGDLEVAKRCAEALKQIDKEINLTTVVTKETDEIETNEFKVVGKITNETIEMKTSNFGVVTISLHEILYIKPLCISSEAVLDASKYANASNLWYDTQVNVSQGIRLKCRASGKVDLYPTEPNKYISSPNGLEMNGPQVVIYSGTLIGKIGDKGENFVVGEHFEGAFKEQGRLYLRIQNTPWNNQCIGYYDVVIKTE